MRGFSRISLAAIMGDETKRIGVDVTWREDEDHSPAGRMSRPTIPDELW